MKTEKRIKVSTYDDKGREIESKNWYYEKTDGNPTFAQWLRETLYDIIWQYIELEFDGKTNCGYLEDIENDKVVNRYPIF